MIPGFMYVIFNLFISCGNLCDLLSCAIVNFVVVLLFKVILSAVLKDLPFPPSSLHVEDQHSFQLPFAVFIL